MMKNKRIGSTLSPANQSREMDMQGFLFQQFIIGTSQTVAATDNHLFYYRHLKGILSFSKRFEAHDYICSPHLYVSQEGWQMATLSKRTK